MNCQKNKKNNFELWLETEIGDPLRPANRPQQNFCNINITFDDGRFYALNVWTFDFLPLARFPYPYAYETTADATPASYVLAEIEGWCHMVQPVAEIVFPYAF